MLARFLAPFKRGPGLYFTIPLSQHFILARFHLPAGPFLCFHCGWHFGADGRMLVATARRSTQHHLFGSVTPFEKLHNSFYPCPSWSRYVAKQLFFGATNLNEMLGYYSCGPFLFYISLDVELISYVIQGFFRFEWCIYSTGYIYKLSVLFQLQ